MRNSNFIVHYNRSEPFRSITAVSQKELPAVLSNLSEINTWGLSRFTDSAYLTKRYEVERKMYNGFIAKGGKPQLENPFYFFLGRNFQFEEYKSNIGYKIDLCDLPIGTVSFTYGDSMFSMCDNYRSKLENEYLSSLCSEVYSLDELDNLFSRSDKLKSKLHIECQLWAYPTAKTVKKLFV